MLIMNCSIKKSEFDWSCLQEVTVSETKILFTNVL